MKNEELSVKYKWFLYVPFIFLFAAILINFYAQDYPVFQKADEHRFSVFIEIFSFFILLIAMGFMLLVFNAARVMGMIMLGMIVPLLFVVGYALINGYFDHANDIELKAKVYDVEMAKGARRAFTVLVENLNESRFFNIGNTNSTTCWKALVGDYVLLKVKPGFLGTPWIYSCTIYSSIK